MPHEVQVITQATTALQTVQASPMQDPGMQVEEGLFAIAGWCLAGICFLGIIALQLRMRRREELYLHGDGPDLYLLPPTRRRK